MATFLRRAGVVVAALRIRLFLRPWGLIGMVLLGGLVVPIQSSANHIWITRELPDEDGVPLAPFTPEDLALIETGGVQFVTSLTNSNGIRTDSKGLRAMRPPRRPLAQILQNKPFN